jgi:hypothetical protein
MDSPSRMNTLGNVVRRGYDELLLSFPTHERLGYTVFLGRQYAQPEPGVLMLGLNPGISSSTALDAELQSENWLLEGAPSKLRYWTHARYFFRSNTSLLSAMQAATFSFCCPYRTRGWDLPVAHRRTLMASARPVLQRILDDCSPRFVILAGIETEQVFQQTLGAEVVRETVRDGPYTRGKYRSRATRATWRGRPLTICQVPHFSRANEKLILEKCAAWLSGILEQ